MITKTRGIVLKTIKYSDSSLIVKIFTELFGLRSYLIRGIHNKKNGYFKNSLQPLNILSLTVTEKYKSNFQSIKEIEHVHLYRSLPYDIKKECITLFMNELLYKTLRQETPDKELFNFIARAMIELDESKEGFENFHLQFMTDLSGYLGFAPRNNYSEKNCLFDLQEGAFVDTIPSHSFWVDRTMSYRLYHLITHSDEIPKIINGSSIRNELLSKLIEYYRLHISDIGEFKSPRLLHEVLV